MVNQAAKLRYKDDIVRQQDDKVSTERRPERVKLSGMRKVIGERMAKSAYTAPHVTLTSEADMSGVVPRCVYTHPEIAAVGLTEAEAEAQGYSVKVETYNYMANGKALALDEPEGFAKIIADEKYGEIFGVVMIGPHVTEMISEESAFMYLEGTVEEMADMIHPHPTVSEVLYEAAKKVN